MENEVGADEIVKDKPSHVEVSAKTQAESSEDQIHEKTLAELSKITYPEAPRGNTFDVYLGKGGKNNKIKVADPYRFFEKSDSEQTQSWVQQENAITKNFLS